MNKIILLGIFLLLFSSIGSAYVIFEDDVKSDAIYKHNLYFATVKDGEYTSYGYSDFILDVYLVEDYDSLYWFSSNGEFGCFGICN